MLWTIEKYKATKVTQIRLFPPNALCVIFFVGCLVVQKNEFMSQILSSKQQYFFFLLFLFSFSFLYKSLNLRTKFMCRFSIMCWSNGCYNKRMVLNSKPLMIEAAKLFFSLFLFHLILQWVQFENLYLVLCDYQLVLPQGICWDRYCF